MIYRQLGDYKDYVANKSAPEGCIAEAYIAHECVTYKLQPHELVIAHWWVLINCPEVEYWKDIHLNHPNIQGDLEYHNREFADYFGGWVRNLIFLYGFMFIA